MEQIFLRVKNSFLWALCAVFILVLPALCCGAEKGPVFDVITVSSAITPPVAQYVLNNIDASAKEGAQGLIILLDTPGGLDLAMRDIAKGILNSPIPVIVFVYPSGARAASAGVIITVAAHIAAMAPGTNIGAAHPVSIGIGGAMDKTMARKVENDAVAYVRGIARQKSRNEDWVEKAVRKSESITAEDALKNKVVDYVATDVKNLLEQADNKAVSLSSGRGKIILKTRNAVINEKKMGLRQSILAALSDPNIAYLLMLVGLAGLYFEFTTPGALLPGIIGGICLLLSFFALQTLPVNYAGVLLILFGILLFIAEIKVISHGLLTIGGIISLIFGSLMLFNSPDPAMRVSLQVLIPAVAVISFFFAVVIALVVKAQMQKRYTGVEAMVGEDGEASTDVHEDGRVFIKGEYWRAFSDQKVEKGRKVRVVNVEGMKLKVGEIK
jgi:membrane-bound serine protease (ClpP class)